ncbi:MAG: hypothetical protein HY223_02870 [Thaumarchaeota archaeon]|nr:hypothetical protein [Nitrososphaerota archaeon]
MNRIERGNSKLTRKKDIEEIFALVNARPTDAFCDFGCGQGLACIYASRKLSFAIGIEDHRENYLKAQKNKNNLQRGKVSFFFRNYENFETIPKLNKCTIFYCTNELDYGFYKSIEEFLSPKRVYFVSQYFAPFPLMSKKYDEWYVMKTPFKIAKNEKEWIAHMLGKGKTRKDLLRSIQGFPDYEDKKKELAEDIGFIRWLCRK